MTRPNKIAVPTIETVDLEIEGGFPSLAFAPDLERLYEDETRHARERYLIGTCQLATILYDLFLVSDWQMTPDVFRAALVARVGIFTPLFLLVWFLLSRSPPPWIREGILSGSAIASVTLLMVVLTMSHSPDLAVYQYGTVLIMLFTAVVQRLRIRYAAATILAILAIQVVTADHLHGMTSRLMANVVVFFLTASILLIWAAYTREREQRRSYLLDLRSRILNDHLDQIAKQDALTGLWNRRHLATVMTAAWTDAQAAPRPMSVVLLDIDHFKAFNDSQGHLEGDKCLQLLAGCVGAAVEGEDGATAVRFGGEEFIVFIDGADSALAVKAAERIQSAIKKAAIPHPALGDGGLVTASFGVATGPAPFLAMNKLVATADDALYASKRGGRDRVSPVTVLADQTSSPDATDLALAS